MASSYLSFGTVFNVPTAFFKGTGTMSVPLKETILPKSFSSIISTALIPKRTLFRSIGMIISEILPPLGLSYHPISAKKLVFLFGTRLSLPIGLQLKALRIIKDIFKTGGYTGKDPKGLAAAVLYFVAKDTIHKKTQSEIAIVANVTEVTIRSRLKDISKTMTCIF